MIAFNPEITVEIGSTVSIICSFLCLIGFYLVYRQSRNRITEMATKIEKLSEAFTSLTNVLIGEKPNENELQADGCIPIDPSSDYYRDWTNGVRNSREAKTVPENNEGKDS